MTDTPSRLIAQAEASRWFRDRGVVGSALALTLLSGLLTFLAVQVSAGLIGSGGQGVSVQSTITLGASSTSQDLVALAVSSLTMLVPIAAVVIGVLAAGAEMSSGALLTLAVAARRMRLLFVVRGAVITLLAALAGALAGAAALAAASLAVRGVPDVSHLSPWEGSGITVAGAAAQAGILALLTFGLSALSRRWVLVLTGLIVYVVALEPVLTGLLGAASGWLPHASTSDLMLPDTDLTRVLPTLTAAVLVVAVAILDLRRDRAVR